MTSVNLKIKPVQGPSGDAEIPISIDTSCTVEELKEKVAPQVNIPAKNIRLVCAGRIWQDAQTIGSYEPKDGVVVHCLNNPQREGPPATDQTLAPANPMSQMMGAAAPAPNSGDPFSQMMAQTQQQMMQNPEMMQQLMNSPMVQQMMSNPDMLRAMVRMNPQLNELMEQRPEIARMLEDPELLQQSLRMVANPSLMREMTRNADRALGQLDAMPGGHNALVRAHEEFADPLFEAMSGGGGGGGSTNPAVDYSQDTSSAPNNEALPNPWGPPSTPSMAPPPTGMMAPPRGPYLGVETGPMPDTTGAGAAPGEPILPATGSGPGGFMTPWGLPGFAPVGPGGITNAYAAASGTTSGTTGTTPMAGMSNMPAPIGPFGGMGGMGPPMGGMGGMGPPMGGMGAPMGGMGAPMGGMGGMGGGFNMAAMMNAMNAMNAAMGQAQGTSTSTPTEGVPAGAPAASPAAPLAAANPLNRMRFQSQLAQLSSMGFTNEAACLRALARHEGRVDAAIDSLLAGDDDNP